MDAAVETETERWLRHQVAATTLLLVSEGILGYSGHVSARLPGAETFLIQPVDQSRAELKPEHLLVCGLDGKKRSGPDGIRPPSEVFLHSEIYRARPDVHAIAITIAPPRSRGSRVRRWCGSRTTPCAGRAAFRPAPTRATSAHPSSDAPRRHRSGRTRRC